MKYLSISMTKQLQNQELQTCVNNKLLVQHAFEINFFKYEKPVRVGMQRALIILNGFEHLRCWCLEITFC